ncbi:cupin domain-containing protein [Bacteroidota bacterium]
MKKVSRKNVFGIYFALGIIAMICASCSNSPEIVVQNLQMQLPSGMETFTEELLEGEIAEIKIEHLAFTGPAEQTITLSDGSVSMFLFLRGNGILFADSMKYSLVPESIAIPMNEIRHVKFEVPAGEVVHFLQFTKKLSSQDLEDLKNFPAENKYKLFFTRFVDCEPYTEKIKSPNTISRTVLPADIVPRVSLGTVEAIGPDEVGAHKHPMLDQLFLGLSDNDVVVFADGDSTLFKEYSLLHIPIGSSHWVGVSENKKMYYMWMDFFLTKEGQEWLKMHKPVNTDKNEY